MKYLLMVLLNPKCWLQNYRYSRKWDAILNELLATHQFKVINRHEASLGNFVVWIENHPYASFTPRNGDIPNSVRPKRTTILRAYDRLIEDATTSRSEYAEFLAEGR